MKTKVLLLHGWGGSDFPHWQSWLAGEIAKNYGTLSFIKLGDFEFPEKKEWMNTLKKEMQEFKPDVVVTHSLGSILWLHLCNEEEIEPVQKLYLVAPPRLECKIKELSSFFPLKAPKNLYAKEALLITSNTDPYISPTEAKKLQQQLNIEMKVLDDAGHINAQSNYGEWPWILKELLG